MNLPTLKSLALTSLLALAAALSARADATKTGTGTDLTGNDATAWTGGSGLNGSPGSGDNADWISTSLATGLTIASPVSWNGIIVSGALTNINISGAGSLTLGGGGVTITKAPPFTNMTIGTPIILGASQAWVINTGAILTNSGVISGTGMSLTKSGAGTLVLNAANTFDGGFAVTTPSDVTGVTANNSTALGTGPVTITGGNQFSATLQVGSGGVALANNITIQPTGVGSGRAVISLPASSSLTGPITVDGSFNAANIAVLSSSAGPSAPVVVSGTVTHSATGTNLFVVRGSGGFGRITGSVSYGALTVQFLDTTRWEFSNAANIWGLLDINNAGAYAYVGAVNTLCPSGIVTGSGANGTLMLNNISTNTAYSQTIGGLSGLAKVILATGSATLTISNVANSTASGYISNYASATISVVKTGPGIQTLAGTNGYTGSTIISNGTLKIINNGVVVSPVISLATGSATYDVSGITGGYHLKNGQTLQGSARVSGPMTVDSGATLTVGGGTGTSTAILTNTGNLTLNGATVLRINKTGGVPANDAIQGFATLTYGGNLAVSNITSDASTLGIGDKFYLFPKGTGSYAGSFVSSNLPPLSGGLAWDLSQLTVDGSIQVYSPTTTFTPVFHPASGGYVGTVSVTITCQTAGATIHYTTDGSTPNSGSPVYSGAITVPAPSALTAIKAYASSTGLSDSSVVAGNYSSVVAPVWEGTAGGSWVTAANWSNNVVGAGAGVPADFSQLTLVSNLFVTLDGPQTIGSLNFGDQGNAYTWELDSGSGGSLALAGATTPSITVSNQSLTLNTVVSSTNGLIANGAGTTIWPVTPAITGGGITVNAGTFQIVSGNFSSQFASSITVNTNGTLVGNTYHATGGGASVILNRGTWQINYEDYKTNVTMVDGTILQGGGNGNGLRVGFSGGNGTFTWNVSNSIVGSLISAPINTIGSGVTLKLNVLRGAAVTNDLTISGVISGAGNLVFTGNGNTALTAGNSYTGTTTVSNGTLQVDGSIASGQVTVNGGRLIGIGSIGGPVGINAGGTLAPGGTGTNMGTLSIGGNLFFNAGSTNIMRISKNYNTVASDLIQSTPLLTAGGTLIVTDITSDGSTFALGDTFTLFSAGSYGVTPFANYVLPALPGSLGWDTSQLLVNGTIAVAANTATPTFNPPAGNYAGPVTVTISSITPGATIYYTTNGTTPTVGSPSGITPVTVSIPVGATMTIQAYASHAGLSDSPVASASYTIYSSAVWNNSGGGSWPVGANWLNNAVPSGSPDITADFSQLALGSTAVVTLDSAPTVGNMIFGDQNNVAGWEIDSGGAGPLTLAVSSGPVSIMVSNQTTTINAGVVVSSGLVKNGVGALVLGGANTYSGATVVSNGTLSAVGGMLGTGTVTLTSGTGGTGLGVSSGTMSNALTTTSGAFTNTLNVASGATFAGSLTGSGTLLLAGGSYTQTRTFSSAANGGFNGALILTRSAAAGGYNFSADNANWSGSDFQFAPTSADAECFATFAGNGTTSIKSVSAFNGGEILIGTNTVLNIVNGNITRATNNFSVAPVIAPASGTSSQLTSSGGTLAVDCTVGPMSINSGVSLVDYNASTPLNVVFTGTNAMTVGGVNANSGTTTVNGGNLQLSSTGTLGTNLVTVTAGGILNNAGVVGGRVVVNAGSLLSGNGTVAGGVTVNANGTLSANGIITGPVAVQSGGTLTTAASGISTLAISNALTLAGKTSLRISKTGATKDWVKGMSSVTYGGTLTVTNLAGTLTNGDSFVLFSLASGGSYSGNFTQTNLPTLDPSLTWNWNPATGTLAVTTVGPSGPVSITSSFNGTSLNLSWPSGQHWRLVSQTNNLSSGLNPGIAAWNTVPGAADGSYSIPVNPANPAVFYELVYP